MTLHEYLDQKTSRELHKVVTIYNDVYKERYYEAVDAKGKKTQKVKRVPWYDPFTLDYLVGTGEMVMRFVFTDIEQEIMKSLGVASKVALIGIINASKQKDPRLYATYNTQKYLYQVEGAEHIELLREVGFVCFYRFYRSFEP